PRALDTSTPFPYTTLFRSPIAVPGHGGHGRGHQTVLRHWATRRRAPTMRSSSETDPRPGPVSGPGAVAGRGGGVGGWWLWGPLRDRKSTRLNSSHVKISYA